MENNQKIKCNVASCKFQNSDYCTLQEILVSYNNCGYNEATKNSETLCQSFECSQKQNPKIIWVLFFYTPFSTLLFNYFNCSKKLFPIKGLFTSKFSAIVAPISAIESKISNFLGSFRFLP